MVAQRDQPFLALDIEAVLGDLRLERRAIGRGSHARRRSHRRRRAKCERRGAGGTWPSIAHRGREATALRAAARRLDCGEGVPMTKTVARAIAVSSSPLAVGSLLRWRSLALAPAPGAVARRQRLLPRLPRPDLPRRPASSAPDFLRKHADEEDAPALFILFVMLAAVAASARLAVPCADGRRQRAWRCSSRWAWRRSCSAGSPSTPCGRCTMPSNITSRPVTAQIRQGAGGTGVSGRRRAQWSGVPLFCLRHRHDGADLGHRDDLERHAPAGVVHGIFAFFFNTVIVAAAVNIVVALAR